MRGDLIEFVPEMPQPEQDLKQLVYIQVLAVSHWLLAAHNSHSTGSESTHSNGKTQGLNWYRNSEIIVMDFAAIPGSSPSNRCIYVRI